MPNRLSGDGILVRVGGHTRSEIKHMLTSAGVLLNVHAETLLAHPAFDAPVAGSLRIVERTVADLGFELGASHSKVFAALREHGLEACPAVTGPFLRLATMDQANAPDSVLSAGHAPSGAIHVVTEPLLDDNAYPKGFYLRVVDGRAWLRGYRCDDTYRWPPEQRLAVVLPGADGARS